MSDQEDLVARGPEQEDLVARGPENQQGNIMAQGPAIYAQGKTKFLTPPVWKIKDEKYADFKFETELWSRFTTVEEEKRGFSVYSLLPYEKGVHDTVRTAIQNNEVQIEAADAVNQIFKVLDKIFLEDDLISLYETWKTFTHFVKTNQTIEEFIDLFDQNIKKLKLKGIELPQKVLALQILDAAKLEQNERQIVLTGVNFNEKEQMFDQMKIALRKYIGSSSKSAEERPTVKEEVLHTTYNEINDGEAFVTSFRRNQRGQRSYRGSFNQSNRGGYNQGFRPNSRANENRGRASARGNTFRKRGSASGQNPRDEYGNIMKCNICQSIMHFRRDCPHNKQEAYSCDNEATNDETKVKIIYNLDYSQDENEIYISHTNAAILDSACSKTVAGKAWKENYLASLDKDKETVKIYDTEDTYFKFGSGKRLVSNQVMEIPCVIGGIPRTILSNIVDSDIPLLLSKPDMKKMGFTLNMANDTLEVNGVSIELDTTSSGHYFIPLKECAIKVEEVHVITELKDSKEKEKVIKKLHRQFGHPSEKSLKDILKNADAYDEECGKIIQSIHKTCEVCKRYTKTPPKPIVSIPQAKQFNDMVAIDLKTFKDIYIIHFTDMFTRFHKSKVIRRKTPKVIVDAVATVWLASGFGAPKKFLVDNGGEFDNEEYRELSEKFNIEICTTSAYSPWSNGICERNHYVVDLCIQKMMEEDPQMSLEVALAWAVNAKNSLQNHLGFSPIQLVTGSHPNLPSVLTNNLPAQEEIIMSETVANHLNALHLARRAFTKAESSERIKRALKHNVRVNEEQFQPGDKVFFKRDDSNRWRGPGKIIGQDGKTLFIRHGSQLVKVATCRAIKMNTHMVNQGDQDKITTENEHENRPNEKSQQELENEEDEDQTEVTSNVAPGRQAHRPPTESTPQAERRFGAVQSTSAVEGPQSFQGEPAASATRTSCSATVNSKSSSKFPKTQDRIRYRQNSDEEWTHAKIISRGGKSTGKNKFYMNVLDETNNAMSGIDLNKVEFEIIDNSQIQSKESTLTEQSQNNDLENSHLAQSENNDEEVNITHIPIGEHWRPDVIQAKQKEIDNWKKFDVFTEVQDQGQKRISTRWVITEKINENDKNIKARLVVRGFEEEEQVQSDSPTAAKSTLRVVMALAANENWKIETIDIKAAFLQGSRVERDIYVTPPKEMKEEGIIWKLNKVAYGLNDASRNWFFSVKEELLRLQMKQSKLDNALFRYYKNGHLEGLMVLHVDDFLFCGTKSFDDEVIENLSKKFNVGKRSANNFKYIGLNINENENGIYVHQNEYAEELEELHIPMHRKSDKQSSLTAFEKEKLMSVAGQLNWLATQTRPDLSYDALELNMSKKEPKIEDSLKANKAIRKAKQISSGILFPKLGKTDDLKINVYSDAAWGNLPDGCSSGQGHIIFLSGNKGCCPLSWTSNKIKRKVASTLSAETLALSDALDEAIYINAVLSETIYDTGENKLNISAFIDNKSLYDNVLSTKQVQEKRLRINIAEIRRMKEQKEVKEIVWIDTKQQLADVMTKRGVDSQPLIDIVNTGNFITM